MFAESIANRHSDVQGSMLLSEILPKLADHPGLMVVEEGKILGGISRGELFRTFGEYWMNEGPASREIMETPVRNFVREVPILANGTPVEVAIDLLVDGAPLVIVEDRRNQPYGVISWIEVNQYLREITGLNDRDSVRFSLALLDIPGQLARVAEVVGRAGANITAITLSDPKVLNWVHVVLRVDREHADIARLALQRAGIDIVTEHQGRVG